MQHYQLGPIEETFGLSVEPEIPEPGTNDNFLWGILFTLAASGIIYLIFIRKKKAEFIA